MVGAGAVGGYFGALLCRAGADVTFLVRPVTYSAILENGLTIKSVNGDLTVHPRVVTSVADLTDVCFIILTVKCYDLIPALKEIAPLIEKGAILLTLQNGVDTEERVLDYYQSDCLVAGVVYITARIARPGYIEHFRRGVISLGEWSGGQSSRSDRLCQFFSQAGIPCRLTRHIRKAKWEKLCWNATFNPLSVILDSPVSLVLHSPALLEIVRQGILEVVAVAEREGIDLDPNMVKETISVSDQFKDFHTSMYEDYKNGRPTEIDHLNGDLVRRGEKWGVVTPIHRMLYALVKGLELKREMGLEAWRVG